MLTGNCRHELVAGADGAFTLKVSAPARAKPPVRLRRPAVAPKICRPSRSQRAATAMAATARSRPRAVDDDARDVGAEARARFRGRAASTGSRERLRSGGSLPQQACDFAFLEPKYSTKPADRTSAEPAAKAEEAASRFADKTAAELVATTSNAAMQGSGQVQPAVNLAAEQKEQLAQKPAIERAPSTRASRSRST